MIDLFSRLVETQHDSDDFSLSSLKLPLEGSAVTVHIFNLQDVILLSSKMVLF